MTNDTETLTLAEASALVGDDIGYWLSNPFMDADAIAQKVCWWITRAQETALQKSNAP